MTTLDMQELESPIGRIVVVAGRKGLCALDFVDRTNQVREPLERRFGPISLVAHGDPGGAVSRIRRYIEGDIAAIDDLQVDPDGTDFQRRVWAALRRIPAGTTASYRDVGRAIGVPAGASRAVGAANGRNPIAIVIPCHRVISSNGELGGYGGGIDRKRWLLEHEGIRFAAARTGRVYVAREGTMPLFA